MAVAVTQPAFTAGEISPSLFGRSDLARYHVGASTFRNGFVSYRGGYYSRAGTAFVGFSKQTGRNFPPRLITFQFSINQGLALEFGNFYMRVISDGAYVLNTATSITNITRANPAVVTTGAGVSAASATPNDGAVTQSYAPGDQVTLAGGTFTVPGVVAINDTKLLSLALVSPGNGVYAPGDTIALTGGVQTTPAQLTVSHTQVIFATIHAAGTGGAPGTATVTGTTGTGTKFQASVTISAGGIITSVNSITVAGNYTVNPTAPAAEPVTGGGLTGAQLGLTIGVLTFTLTSGGVFTTNSAGGTFTQLSTSGSGTGATFGSGLFGPNSCSISATGNYTAFPPNPVAQASTTGTGLGVTFNCTTTPSVLFANGDWVFISGVNGMTQVNGETYVVAGASGTSFQLNDAYGNAIDSTAFGTYTSGGTAASLFTLVTPYAEADLPYLKFTQSADVMSICCVNQDTLTPYPPQDLSRFSDNNWTLAVVSPGASVLPPAATVATASSAGPVDYAYAITSVSPVDGTESVASPTAFANSAVDITATAGSITVGWSSVSTVTQFNVYKAFAYGTAVPIGALFGYVGTAFGNGFVDSNTLADFTQVPPTATNPFLGSSNYPSAVSYFQERRVYANTLNNPDTYYMSQPGAFTNFDSRIPTIDTDAIIGSPWSVQVNGIQFMIPMPGGLVVLTGVSAWQLTGTGGSSLNPQPITPSTQQAQPQAYNGCNDKIPPIRIDYDIIYVQAKGSIVRDLSYQFYTNIYTGIDLTLNSSQLFTGYQLVEWAWCEEPYKVLWAVRDDGVMISLTFLKPQEIAGWARHDTNGLYQSVCSVTEPPVDALYMAVKRFPGTNTAYMIERMDDREWQEVEDCWCVDAALSLGQPEPSANLSASSAVGLGSCTGVTGLVGGAGYSSATTATVVDDNGNGVGTGAVPSLTIVAGVITAVSFAGGNGSGYSFPALVISDPSNNGSGASANIVLNNSATFTASAAVFAGGDVGKVIRMGGGIATITSFVDTTHVIGNITSPISAVLPNSGGTVIQQASGSWSMTRPTATINGLNHLAGMTVTGLADGNVITPRVVSAGGQVTLDVAASSVTIGLGYQAQLQSMYLDEGSPTIQGQRKKNATVTIRMENSRGLQTGANQPDGSVQSPAVLAPTWKNLTVVPDNGPNFPTAPYNSVAIPLRTGDIRVPLPGGYNTRGQVCVQQDYPLPMQVLALIDEVFGGDTPQTQAPKQQNRGRQ